MKKMTTKNEPVTNSIDYWWKKYLAEHDKVQELEKKLIELQKNDNQD